MGFDTSSRTFLSVYLSGEALADPLGALAERLSTLRMEVAERAEEADGFEAGVERLEVWLDEHGAPAEGTLCLFICDPLDACEAVRVPAALPTGLWLDASPYVRPITRHLDDAAQSHEAERAEEAALWTEAQAALRAGEGAVAGVASVMAALKAGKARIVLIVSGVQAPGLRCRRCGAVDLPGHQRCPHCGADERFAVDLIDECVELATWSGAALEYIDGGHLPQMSGVSPGVVALLR